MPNTPRGIWTPADSDDWDLTVDLAAMAASIDTAITNGVTEAQQSDTGWVAQTVEPGITASSFLARRVGNLVTIRGISMVIGTPSASPFLGTVSSQFRPTTTTAGSARTSTGVAAIQVNSSGQVSAFPENQEVISNVVVMTITFLV